MTEEELKKLKDLTYENHLRKCAKKSIQEISLKPKSFARVPEEILDDVYLLATEKNLQGLSKDRLQRLKFICEFFLSTRSKKRLKDEKDDDTFIFDKFTIYEERLVNINHLLLP